MSRLAEKLRKLGMSQEESAATRHADASKNKLEFRVFFPLPPFSGIHFSALKQGNCYNFTGLLLGVGGKHLQKIKQESHARVEVVNAQGNLNGMHPDPMDANLHALITADSMAKLQKAADLVFQVLSPTNAEFEPIQVTAGGSVRLTVRRGKDGPKCNKPKPTKPLKHVIETASSSTGTSNSSRQHRPSLDGSVGGGSSSSTSTRAVPLSPALMPVTPAGTNGRPTSAFATGASAISSCSSSRAPTPSPGAGPTGCSMLTGPQAVHSHLDGLLLPPAALSDMAGPQTPLAMDWPALPHSSGSQSSSATTKVTSSRSRRQEEGVSVGSRAAVGDSGAHSLTARLHSSNDTCDPTSASTSISSFSACNKHALPLPVSAQALEQQHEQPQSACTKQHGILVTRHGDQTDAQKQSEASSTGADSASTAAAAAAAGLAAGQHAAASGDLSDSAVAGWTSNQVSTVAGTGHAGWGGRQVCLGEDWVCSSMCPLTPQAPLQQAPKHQQEQADMLSEQLHVSQANQCMADMQGEAVASSAFKYGLSLGHDCLDSLGTSTCSNATHAGVPNTAEWAPTASAQQHPCELDLLLLRQRAGLVSQACLHGNVPCSTRCGCLADVCGTSAAVSLPPPACRGIAGCGNCGVTAADKHSLYGGTALPAGSMHATSAAYMGYVEPADQLQHHQNMQRLAAAAGRSMDSTSCGSGAEQLEGGVGCQTWCSSWGASNAQTVAVAAAVSSAFGASSLELAPLLTRPGVDTSTSWTGNSLSSSATLPACRSIW